MIKCTETGGGKARGGKAERNVEIANPSSRMALTHGRGLQWLHHHKICKVWAIIVTSLL